MRTYESASEVKGATAPMEEASHTAWRAVLRNPWLWIAMIGFALLILRNTAATFSPLDRDEGAFLTIAQEILHGRIPYRDVFDQKAPAIYYMLAVLLALTSHLSITTQLLAARALAVLAEILTAVGLIMLGRRWWRLEVGIIAALLWLYVLPLIEGDLIFTEPFSTACTVWAVVVLVKWPGMRGALGAGLLLALSSLFKQTAVLALPGMVIILLFQTKQGGAWWRLTRQQVANLAPLSAGVLFPWLVIVGLFTLAGALEPLFNQVVVANVVYPADPFSLRESQIDEAIKAMWPIFLVPPIVVVTGVLRWLDQRSGARRLPGTGAVAAAVIAACNLMPFYSHAYLHYWLQVEPWTILLTAMGLMTIVGWLRPFLVDFMKGIPSLPSVPLGQRRVGLGQLLLLALLGIVLLVGSARIVTSPTYHARYQVLKEQIAAGPWIAQHTPIGSRLLVAPAQPEYYYLSDRLPVTSYIYLLPVNLSPALVAQVIKQVQAEQFDRIIWYVAYDTYTQPANVEIYQQITAHYHSIATDDIVATSPAQLVLYVPDGSGT